MTTTTTNITYATSSIIHQAPTPDYVTDDYDASSTIWYDTFFTGNHAHSTAKALTV